MGLSGLLGTARDALMAQAYALEVTGQNISNVNTPGYARRIAQLEARPAGATTVGGVTARGLERAQDQFSERRYLESSGFALAARTRNAALAPIESVLNDVSGLGLGSSINALFSSFSTLSAQPNDPTARANVLFRAGAFAERMNLVAGQISTHRADLLSQAQGVASEVNAFAQQLASLNEKIAVAEASGGDAADLKDQRDGIVDKLAERVDVTTFTDGAGRMVVRAAGTTLVEGNKASSLEVTTDATGAMKLLARPQGGAPTDVTAQLSGGSLAGLREVRDVDAPAVLGRLDALAYDIASAINAQHAAGVGLDGVGGRPLFAVSAPPDSARTLAVHPDMVGRPDRVAAASAAGMLPAGSDNAMAMARLSEARVAAGGTKSPAEAYADIVGDIGLRKASAAQEADVRDAMRAQASVLRESTRGVSIDEEMIALTRYQRAYEAASKLVKTADELLAGLIRDL